MASGSRPQSQTSRPSVASATASAVPNAPAPRTAITPWPPCGRLPASARPRRRAASAAGRAGSRSSGPADRHALGRRPGDDRAVVGAERQRRRQERGPLRRRRPRKAHGGCSRSRPRRPPPPAPAGCRDARRGRPCRRAAVFSASVSATAAWKPAQRSARSARVIPPCASTSRSRARRTAVLRPEKERSHPSRSRSGRGRAKRSGSPPRAAASTAGPPGGSRPRSFATLSKASPGGVVDGAAQAAEAVRPLDGQELAVAARDEEHEVGKGEIVGQARRQRMAGEVVDAVERQAAPGGESLGEHDAREHAADQPRPGGNRDGVEIGQAAARRVPAWPRSRDPAARHGRVRRSPGRRHRTRHGARPGPGRSMRAPRPPVGPGGRAPRRRRCRRSCSRSRG